MEKTLTFIRYPHLLLLGCFFLLLGGQASAQGILQAEYFWDADPGPGNGTAMLVSDGNFDEAVESVLANSVALPPAGPHSFSVRLMDSTNTWGPAFKTVLYIESAPNIQLPGLLAAEFFWDTDPGQGNGSPLLAFDGNFDEALEQVFANGLNLPPSGLHSLNLRCRDSANTWGPVFTTVVSIEDSISPDAPEIAEAEYFWDVDPGPGNGSPLLAFDGNFDEALEQSLASPSLPASSGLHSFNTRLRDASGQWGPVFTTILSLEDTIAASSRGVVAGEAFWDNDPGPGNGLPLLVLDGNFDEALEAVRDSLGSLSLSLGPHALRVRLRDESNNWGPTFSTVVWVDTSLVPITNQLSGPLTLCANQGLSGHAYSTLFTPGNSYTWSVSGGVITGGQGTNAVTVDWNAVGPHSISVQGCNTNGCGNTYTQAVTIVPALNPTIVHSGATNVCHGDSLLLEAPGGSAYNVTWLFNGSPIANATDSSYMAGLSGNYQVIFSAGPNCPDTSAALSMTVLSPLVSHAGPDQTLCFGVDSIAIGGSPTASGSMSPYNYHWTGAGLGSIGVANPMAGPSSSGYYVVTVQDAAGCESVDSVLLDLNPSLFASAGNDTVLCQGAQVVLGGAPSGSGGSGAFTYSWTPSAGLNNASAANPTASPSASGSYVLTVQDGVGCDAKDTVVVNLHPALFADAGNDSSICAGSSFQIGGNPSASGGDGPYSYLWTPSTGLNDPTLANPTATISSLGNYTLEVQDFNGCTAVADVIISVLPSAVAGFNYTANQGTVDFTDASQDADSIVWDFGDGNSSGQLNPSHTYTASGSYLACQIAFNECGSDTSCQTVNVVIIGTGTGLARQPVVYPNPNAGVFHIDPQGFSLEALTLRDLHGRIVYESKDLGGTSTPFKIQLPDLPSSVYMLEMQGGGARQVVRMVIEAGAM